MECRLVRFYVIHTLDNIDLALRNWLVLGTFCNVEQGYAVGPVGLISLPNGLGPNVSSSYQRRGSKTHGPRAASVDQKCKTRVRVLHWNVAYPHPCGMCGMSNLKGNTSHLSVPNMEQGIMHTLRRGWCIYY